MRDAVRSKERWKRRYTPTQDPSTDHHKNMFVLSQAPDAPFVAASLGQSTLPVSACGGNCGGGILQAMMNVADATKHPGLSSP